MEVYKCIVSSRHGSTLNSRRAASPLVRLVEGEESWESPDHPQGNLPLNWDETELNRSVTCMVLKANANDRCHLALCHDEFRGLDLAFSDQIVSMTARLTVKVVASTLAHLGTWFKSLRNADRTSSDVEKKKGKGRSCHTTGGWR
ncbi:cullin-4A [Trichonephila clavipes]|uniref:Cullin-4A n=1 Tax=Trichonephila clavipes TaxID=2585209 RepID=A0A8X6SH29_TRICX|nr:cullin-4A [Trichonephila clavipes]